jgi:uncharacterized SAM-binding protein YcdF (DUF218 family)
MLYHLGKVLSFLENPLLWLFTLLILIIWTVRKEKAIKPLLVFTFCLWFLSYGPLATFALSLWQFPLGKWPAKEKKYNYAVVLGGFTNPDPLPHDRVYIGRGADRFIHALELYKRGNVNRLILTGGISSLAGGHVTEAAQMTSLFRLSCVLDSVLIPEPNAKTTAENAYYTYQYLVKQHYDPKDTVLVVTSAWHMRRTMACFNKLGLTTKPFAVDPQAGNIEVINWLHIFPTSDAWRKWEILLHELIGLFAYKLAGKA